MSEKEIKISPLIKENKPKLYEKMYNYYQNSDKEGLAIRTVDLSITGKCNLKCKHCYAATYPEHMDVPFEYLEKAIKELLELGAFHFVIQGGEPLINMPRLEKVLECVDTESSFVTVVTNGFYVTDEVLDWLKQKKVDKICVSLDSGIPEEHDENRMMKGAYEKAVSALFKARDKGFQVSFSASISHQNLHSEGIQKLFAFAEENRIRMDIQVAAPVGNWSGREDILVKPEDSEYILQKMMNTKIEDASGQIYLINRDVFSRYGTSGCPALKNFVSITPQGDILPCTFVHISLGNIKEVSIKDALNNGMKVPYFKNREALCLCGEHTEFIRKYLIPAAKSVVEKDKFMTVDEVFNGEF